MRNATMVGWLMVSEPYNIQSIIESELAFNESLGNGSIIMDYSQTSGALYFGEWLRIILLWPCRERC